MPRVLEAQEEPLGGDQSCQGGRHQGVAAQIVGEDHPWEASLVVQDRLGGPEGVEATGYPEGASDALLDMRGGCCSWKQV